MKLNLLPVTVSRGARARNAWIASVVLIIAGIGSCVAMIVISQGDLQKVKAEVDDTRPQAQAAYDTAASADTIVQEATGVTRNANLAKEMIAHNAVFPNMYDRVLAYIPSFFRLTHLAATPVDDKVSTVTMVGTIGSVQQYADLMLALLRNPDVVSVSRQGLTSTDMIVPALTPIDQVGRPRRPGEAPIPDDPLQRLTYFENQGATPRGYTGTGNFGTGTDTTRLAMPGESLVTVIMVVKGNLQTPDPRKTLQAAGGATTSAPSVGAPTTGAPGGPPAGAGAPPSVSAPSAGKGRGKSGEEGD